MLALVGGLIVAGPAAAQSPKPVNIGVMSDMSGLYSQIGGRGSVVAAQMAVDDFGGEIFGRPIKVLSADHLNKPDIAAARAREWVDRDGVVMMTDVLGSATGIAVQNLLAEKNFVIMNTGTASSAITNKECSPYSTHWSYDTQAIAASSAAATLSEQGDSWFFITADYAFGHMLQADATKVLTKGGGKVVGTVKHPLNSSDFSSYILQGQASGAKVIVLANTGGDATNAIRQAKEFGVISSGQKVVPLLIFDSDIKGLGLDVVQGVKYTTGFYWDYDDRTREWSKRFFEKHRAQASMVQAATYSATLAYLQAAKAVGSFDRDKVMAKLRETPIDDVFARNATLREDGLLVHDMYMAQVKTPGESKGEWDIAKVIKVIPGNEAFAPISESLCPYLKRG
ncbi:ABC transporter substrate-binding protein [Achromobacter sp.]|uniref:ABC transporter substrate-binding protein n=1 Tax=Achromobacter sp. TaxID=134375 RepID=UPI000EC324B2|nr:ABC transporter substrate-binding protein [Achromobacter sp.]HCW20205.1 ABC transporter permease [Achromobacter sp.]